MKIGAHFVESAAAEKDRKCEFTLWGPSLKKAAVKVVQMPADGGSEHPPLPISLPMTQDDRGYWHVTAPDLPAGTQYRYQIDNGAADESGDDLPAWPDPASAYQPEGVHGPSEVVDHNAFEWTDGDWKGVGLNDYVIYELHIGTFTAEGTFEAAIAHLPYLVDLGITAVEIMPVAQFPGERNWGYDGAFPFAVQNSYGGPEGLKKLVDACHAHGLAAVLDVVYNHFGPEGNYTGLFGPYMTDHYRTPWGMAVNFDDADSYGVRHYFIQNALSWFRDYHMDALRLDAVHAIYDFSAKHFLQALAEAVDGLEKEGDRPLYLIAESDLNDPRLIRPVEQGGYQLDAQWSDDFHHALHTRLTGEVIGYYSDFTSLETLAFAIRSRFVYAGQYSPSRRRDHGSPALDLPSEKFVVCSQNHDQIGNRMMGDRFSTLISFEGQKLAAGITILSPYLPLLFMGEEYGENAPFLYFVDHGDKDLIEAVRAGRKEEFRAFHDQGTPPDPASLETYQTSTLHWPLESSESEDAEKKPEVGNSLAQQRILHKFYKRLLAVRKQCKIMSTSKSSDIATHNTNDVLYYHRIRGKDEGVGDLLCIMNFGEVSREIGLPLGAQTWQQVICSTDTQWSVSSGPSVAPEETLPTTLTAKTTPTIFAPRLSVTLYQADLSN